MLQVKFNNTTEGGSPSKATEGAAAYDLPTIHGGTITPGEAKVFDTGLQLEIPSGYCMLVFSRSGHGFNKGLRLANCVGVIDSDYRGNVMVKLHNDSNGTYQINAGDRIAQGMFIKCEEVSFVSQQPAEGGSGLTKRGKKGFGSTGDATIK